MSSIVRTLLEMPLLLVRPARSRRPSASMWAGAKLPSSFLSVLRTQEIHVKVACETQAMHSLNLEKSLDSS